MIEIRKLECKIPYASNSYLVVCGDECAVVDPSAPFCDDLLEGKHLKYILLTHGHFDHFLEIDSWANATDADVIISEGDIGALSDSYRNCYSLFMHRDLGYHGRATSIKHGDSLMLGDETIVAEEYPGHTVGSMVYTIGKHSFVGDVVFAGGGYGRCDLPGGNAKSLISSIKKILTLDEDTVLYPGHGDITTVAEYQKDLY